jgi:uncharacterized membrane protein
MAFITGLFSTMSAISTILSLLKQLLDAVEEAEAKAKRDRLSSALDLLHNAKTEDEKKQAVQNIASNSF